MILTSLGLNTRMSYNSNFIQNIATLESGKFLEIVNDTRFPAVSVTRVSYPQSNTLPPITSVDVYPKYALITYDAGSDTTNSLLSSVNGQQGFVFVDPASNVVTGLFTSVKVVSACKFNSLSATNSTVGALVNYELPAGFVLNAPITSLKLTYGAVIAQK